MAPLQLRTAPVGNSKPPENDRNPATATSERAEKADPKFPQPPYIHSAKPISFGGNHSDTILIPITNPAPTIDKSNLEITS